MEEGPASRQLGYIFVSDNANVDAAWVDSLMGFGMRSDHRPVVCVRTFRRQIRARHVNRCIMRWKAGPNWLYEAAKEGLHPKADWKMFTGSLKVAVAEIVSDEDIPPPQTIDCGMTSAKPSRTMTRRGSRR